MNPKYPHHHSNDCCELLGQWDCFDLYYCEFWDSLYVRYGSDVQDFSGREIKSIDRPYPKSVDGRALARAAELYKKRGNQ